MASLRKLSLRLARSNEFARPLEEVFVKLQVDISAVTVVSCNVLKKENKLLQREKKEQTRKVKNAVS